MKRLTFIALILIALATTISGCGGGETSEDGKAGKENVSLQVSWTTSDTEKDPYAITAHKFKEIVEEKSAGRIEVKLYPNNQLGEEREVIEGMSMGTIDMGVITNAPISGFVPEFQVLDLPFIFKNAQQAHEVLDGPAGKELLAKLEQEGIKGLGFAEGGFRQMINNVRPVHKPADVEGVKYRVMKNPIYIGMFKALGANATPMAWGEVFTAVQQGTIDGLEIPIPVIHQNKYYEVTKYLSLTNHTYSPLVVMMSEQKWDTLSPDLQEIVSSSAQEAIEYERDQNAGNKDQMLEDLKAKGMEVNEVEDLDTFKEQVKPLYKDFEDEIGKDTIQMIMDATS